MNKEIQRCQATPVALPSNFHRAKRMTPGARSEALHYRWLIFAVLAGGYVLVYFHRLCPAVVAVDMMHDLQTSGALLGLLGSAYFYPYAIMQLPAGLLADSWGPRRTIALFSVVAFVGSLLMGLSPSVGIAIFGRVLVGLGVAMLFVPTMKILTEWFRPQEFATMTGWLLAMGGVGSLFSAVPLALLTGWLGWRLAFIIVAGLTLLLAGLTWSIVRDRPAELGWTPINGQNATTATPRTRLLDAVRQVLAHRHFWPLALWFFFQSAVFFSFGGLWGGPYLKHIYGLDRVQTGQVLSMLAIGLIFGSPLQTWLSNRVFKGRKPVLLLSSLVTVGLAALLVFATASLALPALYLLCLLMGAFTSASVVIGFSAAKELFPSRISGTAIGLVNLFPFAGGALFQPVLGWILERQGRIDGHFSAVGYQQAFSVLLACAVLALLAGILTKETLGPRVEE
ncbi:MAG: MFS transporter [Desulfuromonadales bacterium]|nr:MFS transporter [Desulfuromonadales bacterium]